MNRKSGSFSLLWANWKEDSLVSDAIFALIVGLLALALAVVFVSLVLPLASG